jgi:hypothetical protein
VTRHGVRVAYRYLKQRIFMFKVAVTRTHTRTIAVAALESRATAPPLPAAAIRCCDEVADTTPPAVGNTVGCV